MKYFYEATKNDITNFDKNRNIIVLIERSARENALDPANTAPPITKT